MPAHHMQCCPPARCLNPNLTPRLHQRAPGQTTSCALPGAAARTSLPHLCFAGGSEAFSVPLPITWGSSTPGCCRLPNSVTGGSQLQAPDASIQQQQPVSTPERNTALTLCFQLAQDRVFSSAHGPGKKVGSRERHCASRQRHMLKQNPGR